jgi:hypothetical protein
MKPLAKIEDEKEQEFVLLATERLLRSDASWYEWASIIEEEWDNSYLLRLIIGEEGEGRVRPSIREGSLAAFFDLRGELPSRRQETSVVPGFPVSVRPEASPLKKSIEGSPESSLAFQSTDFQKSEPNAFRPSSFGVGLVKHSQSLARAASGPVISEEEKERRRKMMAAAADKRLKVTDERTKEANA